MTSVFIILLCAHCLGDFLLQTDWIARNKRRLWVLALHASMHGALAYVLLQKWEIWKLPLLLGALHFAVDFLKARVRRSATSFAADQAAHVILLAALSWWAVHSGQVSEFSGLGWAWIVLLSGFSAVVRGAGFFVGEVAEALIRNNPGLEAEIKQGLKEGGKMIGQLERALVFLFLGIGYPEGIGFLVAAKSILRFEEAKKQPLAEYVLVGTLLSFSLAVALSWLTLRVLEMAPKP